MCGPSSSPEPSPRWRGASEPGERFFPCLYMAILQGLVQHMLAGENREAEGFQGCESGPILARVLAGAICP